MTFFTLGVDLQGRSAVAVGAGEQGVFGPQSELAVEGLQSAGFPAPSTSEIGIQAVANQVGNKEMWNRSHYLFNNTYKFGLSSIVQIL